MKRLVKGSKAAKAYMAKLRAMQKGKPRRKNPHTFKASEYDALIGEVRAWWIAPAKSESYTARFQGTFPQALERAAESSALWKSKVSIFEDRSGQPVAPGGVTPAPCDYFGALWATVSVVAESPLRGGTMTPPFRGTYKNPRRRVQVVAHNAKARAIISKMNPLTLCEATALLSQANKDADEALKYPPRSASRGFAGGYAMGQARAVRAYGPSHTFYQAEDAMRSAYAAVREPAKGYGPSVNPAPSFVVIDTRDGTVVYSKAATGTGDAALRDASLQAQRFADIHKRDFWVFLNIAHGIRRGSKLQLPIIEHIGVSEVAHPSNPCGGRGNPRFRARYISPESEVREEVIRARGLQGALKKAHLRAEKLPPRFVAPHSSVEVDRINPLQRIGKRPMKESFGKGYFRSSGRCPYCDADIVRDRYFMSSGRCPKCDRDVTRANPGLAPVVSVPVPLEAGNIAKWLRAEGVQAQVDPYRGQWGVMVPRAKMAQAKRALGKVLANPSRRALLGEARELLRDARADVRAGHKGAAEYWKGKASGLAQAALSNSRPRNPLTRKEAARLLRTSAQDLREAKKFYREHPGSGSENFHYGMSLGYAGAVLSTKGPKQAQRIAHKALFRTPWPRPPMCSLDVPPGDRKCHNQAALLVQFGNDQFKQWHPVCDACARREMRQIVARKPLTLKNPLLQMVTLANPGKRIRPSRRFFPPSLPYFVMVENKDKKSWTMVSEHRTLEEALAQESSLKVQGLNATATDRFGTPIRRSNPGTPTFKACPFREGQKVSIAQARAWAQKSGNRTLLGQIEDVCKLQKAANRNGSYFIWKTIPVGDPKRLEMVTAMAQYGTTDETLYKPPKGSKKGQHLYSHKWGEGSGSKKPVPLLAAHTGKALIMPLQKGQKAGDWLRG